MKNDITKIYFDTEFTSLHKNTTLISIGLVASTGEKFYAETTDYDKTQVNEWIQDNVISNLFIEENSVDGNTTYHKGDSCEVRDALLEWLNKFSIIEWVSDVAHYDFVLLIDLVYGHALNMPYGKHCAACHDINQDIAVHYNISEIEAFDKSRESIVDIEVPGNKHNALYDALVIEAVYEKINGGA